MVSASFMQGFFFLLVLTVVMAVVAYSRRCDEWRNVGSALLESGIWVFSLIACAGTEYLVMMLYSNHTWVGA
jgi:hypothetical protein